MNVNTILHMVDVFTISYTYLQPLQRVNICPTPSSTLHLPFRIKNCTSLRYQISKIEGDHRMISRLRCNISPRPESSYSSFEISLLTNCRKSFFWLSYVGCPIWLTINYIRVSQQISKLSIFPSQNIIFSLLKR